MTDIKKILTDSGNAWSASTTILFPGDEEFAKATTRWAIYKPPTYTACISPGTEEDVVKAVRYSDRSWKFQTQPATPYLSLLLSWPSDWHDD